METLSFDHLPNAISLIGKRLENIEKLLLEKSSQSQIEETDQILTLTEAAVFLNLKPQTIYSMVSRRELPVMKRSKRLYFSKMELLAYLKTGRKLSSTEMREKISEYLKSK